MLTIAAKKKHRGIKLNPVERVGMAVVYLICIMAGILTIVPFLYIVAGSFATEKELVERAFFIIPHTFSLNAYKYIIADGSIFRGLANSFFIMIAGTVVNMAFTTTLAYPLSKSNLKRRNVVLNVIIVTMLFSGGMIPNYLVVKGLGLLDSYWALMLPGAVNAFNLIIVKNFFQELPHELEEAARIDGCSDVGIFAKIILPLSKPVISALGIFTAVGTWNDYTQTLYYTKSADIQTLSYYMLSITKASASAASLGETMSAGASSVLTTMSNSAANYKTIEVACMVLSALPLIIVYPFAQKFFEKGVMVGSVKG